MLRSTRRVLCLVAGAAVVAAGSASGSGPAAAIPDDVIRATLGISAYTLQAFTPPAGAELGFDATFVLGGVPRTVRFTPTEIHDPACVMSIDTGTGELIDLPPPPAGIYEGSVLGAGGSAIAQMLNGRLSALVKFGGESWQIQPLTDVLPGAEPALHVVVNSADVLASGGVCGNPDNGHGHPAALGQAGSAWAAGHAGSDGPLICQVACESDYQFSNMHSLNASATAQDIAKVMAWAGKFFTEGANVKFVITRYVIRLNPLTNPYTSSDAGTLLGEFRSHWNLKFTQTTRDLAHLFTGRDLDGATIGIGSIGVVCSQTMGYALSQSLFNPLLGKRAALTAHEMGHNFSAQHCDQQPGLCAPCRIMLAAQGTGAQNLSFGCSGPFIGFYAQQQPCLDPSESAGGGPCRADMNFDGMLTVGDFAAFQSAFAAGLVPLADFNGDGRLTSADFGAFQSAYTAGCAGR